MNYENFDLAIELINPATRRYRTRVLYSPAGEADAEFEMPFTHEELSDFFWLPGHTLRHLRSNSNSAEPRTLNAKAFGAKLYDTVFVGDVGRALARSIDEVERKQKGLRIRLRLNEAFDLADLPWEFLYATDRNRSFTLFPETPLVRYLNVASPERPLLVVQPPLRILCIVSCPSDNLKIDVEKEWEHLQDALKSLQNPNLIVLERLPTATLSDLRTYLRQNEIHILHFIGHGYFDLARNERGLVFEDDRGQGHNLSAERLSVQLSNHKSLRLIFLNACEGARNGDQYTLGGVAQNLVLQGIPSVLAMQFPISDNAATNLAYPFYKAIAKGDPVDTALALARRELFTDGNDVEWGTPVLYMRTAKSTIFEVKSNEARDSLYESFKEYISSKNNRIKFIALIIVAIVFIGTFSILFNQLLIEHIFLSDKVADIDNYKTSPPAAVVTLSTNLKPNALEIWLSSIQEKFNATGKLSDNFLQMNKQDIPTGVVCDVAVVAKSWYLQKYQEWMLMCVEVNSPTTMSLRLNGTAIRGLLPSGYYTQENPFVIYGEGGWPEDAYRIGKERSFKSTAIEIWATETQHSYNPTGKPTDNTRIMSKREIRQDLVCQVGIVRQSWFSKQTEEWQLICSMDNFQNQVSLLLNGVAARGLTGGSYYTEQNPYTIYGRGAWWNYAYKEPEELQVSFPLMPNAIDIWLTLIHQQYNPTGKLSDNMKPMALHDIPQGVICDVAAVGNGWLPKQYEEWQLICSMDHFRTSQSLRINGTSARGLTNDYYYTEENPYTVYGEGLWPEQAYDLSQPVKPTPQPTQTVPEK